MQNLFPQEGAKQLISFPQFANDGEWVNVNIIDTANKKIKWSFTGGPFGSNLKNSDYTTSGIKLFNCKI
jgi:type I restriction enzyme S subunit